VYRSSRPGNLGRRWSWLARDGEGNKRQLESIRSMFGQDIGTERKSIAIQRWEIAATVYRLLWGSLCRLGSMRWRRFCLVDEFFCLGFGVDGAQAPAKK